MTSTAYLSLGSNLDDRLLYLREAVQLLHGDQHIEVSDISSLYETDPVGYTNQGNFLNIVVELKTTYTAEQLLSVCQSIENTLGRKRVIRWGPRTVDLDILLFNHENIETDDLSVPHPRMHERAFVIIPLVEIEPNIQLPTSGQSFNEILERIPDKEGVRLWKRKNGEDVFEHLES
ncbi:2-amino-4-hydroxy-6-hydroxymethyldihydropteridine diphosphokinase [Bacillus massiliigorillae]|uniref:2-amino-4-hydroxy-6- hydroxymethyldihydropteridine diphosphokinase n=1 Tax=Bacillus massiliigorillae TaxID=1243664 RepID=UPI0003A0B1DF|nr:2-amino-4-hydroxy-6-hydroxymethyldihydropteridine diphosphokinase [Bacillus massiliigorillae]